MTDLVERIESALKDYRDNLRSFGEDVAALGLGAKARVLLPEALAEIETLRLQVEGANAIIAEHRSQGERIKPNDALPPAPTMQGHD